MGLKIEILLNQFFYCIADLYKVAFSLLYSACFWLSLPIPFSTNTYSNLKRKSSRHTKSFQAQTNYTSFKQRSY